MKPTDLRRSEAGFLKAVLELAQLYGWRSAHFRPAMTRSGRWVTAVQGDGVGFPDLILLRERLVVIETKSARGRLTPEQRAWLEAFDAVGAQTIVARPADWDMLVETLR